MSHAAVMEAYASSKSRAHSKALGPVALISASES
jgi:hypothetical protein